MGIDRGTFSIYDRIGLPGYFRITLDADSSIRDAVLSSNTSAHLGDSVPLTINAIERVFTSANALYQLYIATNKIYIIPLALINKSLFCADLASRTIGELEANFSTSID